jgi:2'-5' RNA ligase
MRLFAAIDPPAAAVAHLEAAVSQVPQRGLRWMPTEQWHITLAFYGEVDRDTADDLRLRLARAAERTSPLTLRLASVGCFPRHPVAARVLWAGVDGDVDDLRRLADRCRAAGKRSGAAVDDRRFRGHLTLARTSRQPVDVTSRVTALSAYGGPPWQAESVRLVQSTLGAHTHHETVAQWPLGHQVS